LRATTLSPANDAVLDQPEVRHGRQNTTKILDLRGETGCASVNAHDTAPFPELFAETYIQHSGRRHIPFEKRASDGLGIGRWRTVSGRVML